MPIFGSRRRHLHAPAATSAPISISIALLMAPSAAASAVWPWTICNSSHGVPLPVENRPPPSKWDKATHRTNCFSRRGDRSSAPGTALFQRWLSDYGKGDVERGGASGIAADGDGFDPRSDFPTWEVVRRYPDIGEGGEARDYYTLWYTAMVEGPELEVEFPGNDGKRNDEGDGRRKRGHLTLHGVNYRPVVYFEGRLLRPYSTSADGEGGAQDAAGGMFVRRHYDLGVKDAGRSTSSSPLEILVLPPPYVGRPVPLDGAGTNGTYYGLEAGQGGDHELAKSGAVMQFTAGWDWIQSTPDRNTGVWDRVEVVWAAGDVRLHDVHVRVADVSVEDDGIDRLGRGADGAALPLGDDVTVSARLDLSLTATNHRSGARTRGRFEYWITPAASDSTSSSATVLARGTVRNVTLHRSVSKISLGRALLPNARLWWPHTHSLRSRQPLYSVHVEFLSDGDRGDDVTPHESRIRTNFGIRTVSSFTHPATRSFALRVNGHPIFLTGGNWIATDQFLRYSDSPERYVRELSLLRHAGLNAVRVWGGGLAETDRFYDAADALGMLVYQEFWTTGDCNGRFGGSRDWPVDRGSYLANARDTVLRLRNRPSLVVYAGGNELSPPPSEDGHSSTSPPDDIEEGLRRYVAELDGGRPYVSSSVTEVGNDFDPARALGPKDGPYGMQPEEIFFDRNPGLTSPLLSDDEIKLGQEPADIDDADSPGRNIGFQTEVGSVSHPELESLRRFMSPEALKAYPDCGERSAFGNSVHGEWTYFKYIPFTEDMMNVDHVCQFAFPPRGANSSHAPDGRMDSIEDYTWAAQLAQYMQHKSLFEGYAHRMWEWYSAVFHWKVSSPAPTFRGALYDWYLATNGGYWGVRAALAGGSPVRPVLNLRDRTVHVVNASPVGISASVVKWSARSLGGVLVAEGEIPLPGERVDGNTVAHPPGSVPWVGDGKFLANLRVGMAVQDIILYRLELSYASHDDLGTTLTAKNAYYLTDPAIGRAESRFSLLGALRKETPRINLDARCTVSSGIECAIQNPHSHFAAVMIKLSIVRSSQNNAAEQADHRVLPTLFSDNYLTLLPGEAARVHISLEDMDLFGHIGLLNCSSDGFLKPMGNKGIDLKVSVDGWNVGQTKIPISCGTSPSTLS